MDGLTNVLLMVLIGLLGTIGTIFYNKIEQFAKSIQEILLSDVDTKKDIERNTDDIRKNTDDIRGHEMRINTLEKK